MTQINLIQPSSTTTDLPLHCAFDADDWAKLARHWYPIALSRDVADGPIAARLLDELLVVYRIATKWW
jgi:vanillate O-demethylase monooxygenase subunit